MDNGFTRINGYQGSMLVRTRDIRNIAEVGNGYKVTYDVPDGVLKYATMMVDEREYIRLCRLLENKVVYEQEAEESV